MEKTEKVGWCLKAVEHSSLALPARKRVAKAALEKVWPFVFELGDGVHGRLPFGSLERRQSSSR
jgi:hypothetical protein